MLMAEVLVVEAQIGVRKALERLLEGLGLRFRSVGSGAQAERESRDWRPDLVIAGLSLPDQSGLELCRKFHQAALPVVLLGDIDPDDAQAAGAAGTLQLPLEAFELSTLIHSLFGTQSQVAPTAGQLYVEKLLERPGVLAVTFYDAQGAPLHSAGIRLPEGLGRRARTSLSDAHWLAQSQSSGPHDALPPLRGAGLATRPLGVIQVEYGERCLLLFEQPGGIVACLLRESASASLMKYWLRSSNSVERLV